MRIQLDLNVTLSKRCMDVEMTSITRIETRMRTWIIFFIFFTRGKSLEKVLYAFWKNHKKKSKSHEKSQKFKKKVEQKKQKSHEKIKKVWKKSQKVTKKVKKSQPKSKKSHTLILVWPISPCLNFPQTKFGKDTSEHVDNFRD